MKMRLSLTLLSISFLTQTSWATRQNSLGFELGVGFPQISIATDTLNAKYSGASVQGNVLFPLLNMGAFLICNLLILSASSG